MTLPLCPSADWLRSQASRARTACLYCWSESSTAAIFPQNSLWAKRCLAMHWQSVSAVCPNLLSVIKKEIEAYKELFEFQNIASCRRDISPGIRTELEFRFPPSTLWHSHRGCSPSFPQVTLGRVWRVWQREISKALLIVSFLKTSCQSFEGLIICNIHITTVL